MDDSYYQIMTVEEVSKFLHISGSSVYDLVSEKEISHIRFGKSIRFRRCDVEDFILSKIVLKNETKPENNNTDTTSKQKPRRV